LCLEEGELTGRVYRLLMAIFARTPPSVRKRIYASETVHRVGSRVADAVYGDDAWQWCRIAGGPANTLWIQAQPRTHKFQIAGTYEPAIARELSHYPAGTVVWDIGAHIGYFVLVALRLGHHVVAVEPNPESAERIRATLTRNELDATIVEAALGASPGVAYLNRTTDSSMAQIASRGTAVSMTTLDTLYLRYVDAPPGVLKIDVEGYEIDVLKGGRRLLDEARPTLLIEVHSAADNDRIPKGLIGYDLQKLDSGHLLARPR
jgi:FkbM family methyltransferase